jgi:hypothetical protein
LLSIVIIRIDVLRTREGVAMYFVAGVAKAAAGVEVLTGTRPAGKAFPRTKWRW